eukprot:scaffold3025_cov132-Isochrysis_galbana.AAC.2
MAYWKATDRRMGCPPDSLSSGSGPVRAAIGRSSASSSASGRGEAGDASQAGGGVGMGRALGGRVRAWVGARTKVRELEVDQIARELDEGVTQPNEVAAAFVHLRRGGTRARASMSGSASEAEAAPNAKGLAQSRAGRTAVTRSGSSST